LPSPSAVLAGSPQKSFGAPLLSPSSGKRHDHGRKFMNSTGIMPPRLRNHDRIMPAKMCRNRHHASLQGGGPAAEEGEAGRREVHREARAVSSTVSTPALWWHLTARPACAIGPKPPKAIPAPPAPRPDGGNSCHVQAAREARSALRSASTLMARAASSAMRSDFSAMRLLLSIICLRWSRARSL
jgi:hypothetical protein